MNSNRFAPGAPFGGLEFSTFRLRHGVSEAELLAAAKRAREGLMARQPGFLGHAVLRQEQEVEAGSGSQGQGHGYGESAGAGPLWVDLLWAETRQRAQEICALWVGHPDCADYLALIEPGSARLGFYTRLG